MAGQLLLSLSILVILHEWGHFITARIFGMRVENFYLFFDAWGFKLFSFKRGETEYGIGWLPLGGYVKISGMIDESMDKDQMRKPAESWEFRSKPAWQRLIVMLGGVTVNAILGVIIFTFIMFHYGETKLPLSEAKYGIVARELGQEIGLKTGDKIFAVNNKEVKYFDELVSTDVLLGDNVVYNVDRNGEIIEIPIAKDFANKFLDDKAGFIEPRTPVYVKSLSPDLTNARDGGLMEGDKITSVGAIPISFYDELQAALLENKGKIVEINVIRGGEQKTLKIKVSDEGKIGFFPDLKKAFVTETVKYSLANSIPKGISKATKTITDQLRAFKKIFKREVSASKSLSGPLGMATAFGGKWNWEWFWTLTGLISIVLAFMNLLPIPALDGGHVVFLLIEMVIRRPVSEKVMEYAQYVGMFLLFALMIFATGNDIYKLFVR